MMLDGFLDEHLDEHPTSCYEPFPRAQIEVYDSMPTSTPGASLGHLTFQPTASCLPADIPELGRASWDTLHGLLRGLSNALVHPLFQPTLGIHWHFLRR